MHESLYKWIHHCTEFIIAQMNEACLEACNPWKRPVTHMNESVDKCEWVMLHIIKLHGEKHKDICVCLCVFFVSLSLYFLCLSLCILCVSLSVFFVYLSVCSLCVSLCVFLCGFCDPFFLVFAEDCFVDRRRKREREQPFDSLLCHKEFFVYLASCIDVYVDEWVGWCVCVCAFECKCVCSVKGCFRIEVFRLS